MSNIKFSILIPCYGKAQYIHATIASILSQSYSNFEIIICVQGNTIVEGDFLADSRIKIIRMNKPSPYLSRIELFKKAIGEYVWFVDDDDEITDGSLEKLDSIIQAFHPDCVVFDKVDVIGRGEEKTIDSLFSFQLVSKYDKQEALEDLLTTNKYNSVCQKIYKNELSPEWITTDLLQSEDKLLNYTLYKSCKTILRVEYPFYKYYLSHGNWTHPLTVERINDAILSREILIKHEPSFTDCLLEDILDRMVLFLSTPSSKDHEDDIRFNPDEYDFSRMLKKVSLKKRILFKAVLNKRYYILRFFGNCKNIKRPKKQQITAAVSNILKKIKGAQFFLIPLLSFALISPITLTSSYSKIQDVAKVITNETKQKGFTLVTFIPSDQSTEPRPSFSSEYTNLHDQFGSYSKCLETYDAAKEQSLRVVSFSNEFDGKYYDVDTTTGNDLTLLGSPGIQIEESQEKIDGFQQTVYRNVIYKFQFKYRGLEKGNSSETRYPFYCAVHQRQADELIELIKKESGVAVNEEQLLGYFIKVNSINNDDQFVFRIFNIIKDNSDHLEDYNSCLGNFLFVNDYMLGDKELCNSYMMTKTEYENYYNLKTRTNIYKKIGFKILFGNRDTEVTEKAHIQSLLDDIMNERANSTILFGILLFFDSSAFVCFLIILSSKKVKKNYTLLTFGTIVPVLPYIIFKIIVLCSKTCSAFSYLTGNIYFVFTIIYELTLLFLMLRIYYANK